MATQPKSYMTEHAIKYTIRTHATPFTRRSNGYASLVQRRCTLAKVAIADGEPLHIPCFYCSGSPNSSDDYVGHYQQRLTNLLHYYFPFISNCCAETVAHTFTSTVLLPANDAHNCPFRPLHGINFATHYSLYGVDIMVYDQQGAFFEEVELKARPAAPVRELVRRWRRALDVLPCFS